MTHNGLRLARVIVSEPAKVMALCEALLAHGCLFLVEPRETEWTVGVRAERRGTLNVEANRILGGVLTYSEIAGSTRLTV